MTIEFHFHIDPTRILVEDPGTGYKLEISNRIVYRRRDGAVLALGDKPTGIAPLPEGTLAWESGEVCSAVLFEADGKELAYEIGALGYFTRLLHRQSQSARPWKHLFAKLGNRFDYILSLPGYEDFPGSRRSALEQNLQAQFRMRRLVINGKSLEIPPWKRTLDYWLHMVLGLFSPYIGLLIVYFQMPKFAATSPLPFLGFMLLTMYGLYLLGMIAWMLISRILVPAEYRMRMLQGSSPRLSALGRLLARLLWGLPKKEA